jgi:hypothetical protein
VHGEILSSARPSGSAYSWSHTRRGVEKVPMAHASRVRGGPDTALAESEVRGGMDVLKVIFWDHAFQPRAAGKNGNFWYV